MGGRASIVATFPKIGAVTLAGLAIGTGERRARRQSKARLILRSGESVSQGDTTTFEPYPAWRLRGAAAGFLNRTYCVGSSFAPDVGGCCTMKCVSPPSQIPTVRCSEIDSCGRCGD